MHVGSSARDGGANVWRELQGLRTGDCRRAYVSGIVSKNTQQDVEVHTDATCCRRRTKTRNISGSLWKGILGDPHTWRNSDAKMFVTEITSRQRLITDECERRCVRVLTHEDRMYNRKCYD